jgi:uncharacterized protein (DUF3820 family)
MRLVTTVTGYVFIGGKYNGKTLEEVANEDPTYVNWFYREETYPLTDEAYHYLVDLMKSRGIPFDRVPKASQENG